jgi:uncharacterized OB-fold protein
MTTNGIGIVPEVSELTRPYWEGAARGALMLQRCRACGRFRHPPTVVCADCGAFEVDWVPASGRGVIYSYTTVIHPVHGAVQDKVPYSVVLVDLEEGVRVVSTVVDATDDDLSIGLSVTALFEKLTPTIGLPKFQIVKGAT